MCPSGVMHVETPLMMFSGTRMFALARRAVSSKGFGMLEESGKEDFKIGSPWVDGIVKDPFVEDCGPLINNCDGSPYLQEDGKPVESTTS